MEATSGACKQKLRFPQQVESEEVTLRPLAALTSPSWKSVPSVTASSCPLTGLCLSNTAPKASGG